MVYDDDSSKMVSSDSTAVKLNDGILFKFTLSTCIGKGVFCLHFKHKCFLNLKQVIHKSIKKKCTGHDI